MLIVICVERQRGEEKVPLLALGWIYVAVLVVCVCGLRGSLNTGEILRFPLLLLSDGFFMQI